LLLPIGLAEGPGAAFAFTGGIDGGPAGPCIAIDGAGGVPGVHMIAAAEASARNAIIALT
jgi:hypothetical protein